MPSVPFPAAEAPLVLALDLGTSSLRALLVDRRGQAVLGSEEQLPYRQRTTSDGGVEADAETLFALLVRSVDGAMARAGDRGQEIAAVGATSFWHSLLGIDAAGEPTTPVLSWADTRSAPQAAALRRDADGEAIRLRTGCRFHSSYWPAKLRWLAETQADVIARTARWVSFAEFAAQRLGGETAAGVTVSMASGTGLLDVHRLGWDGEVLDLLGLTPDRLSPLVDADAGTTLAPAYARRWPALAAAPWYPAIGDGAAANVGSGAIGPGRIALTLGTSGAMRLVLPAPNDAAFPIPPELWAYRLDRDHAVVGGSLSNGGNLLRWARELVGAPLDGPAMAAAAALPPDGHGLTLLPFVAGERAPGWHDGADGVVAGLTLATKPEHLLRATLESVAHRFARISDALRPLADAEHQIVANGGAIVNSPAWLGIVADALGHDLLAMPAGDEATARGAALVALVAAGVLPDLGAAPDPAVGCVLHRPDPERHARYRAGRARQERLEAVLYPSEDGRPTAPAGGQSPTPGG